MTTVQLTDDIDGSPAQQTVRLALDGVAYEIDLTDEHAAQLRTDASSFVAAARSVRRAPASTPSRRGAGAGYDPQAVRAWAKVHDVALPARGRIPGAVVAQFRAAGY